MKKLLATLALLLGSVMAHAQTAGSATDPSNRAEYIYVHNTDALVHEVGTILVWKDSTYDGVDVSSTVSANNALVAGVVAIRDIPASGWGFIQVYGYHATVATDGNVTAGDSLVTSTTGEQCTPYTILMATATAARGIFGTALATDTGNVGPVMINIR